MRNFFVLSYENTILDILKQQFVLAYHSGGTIPLDVIETMPRYERDFYYQELVNAKKDEKESHAKAVAESQARNASRPSSGGRRRAR